MNTINALGADHSGDPDQARRGQVARAVFDLLLAPDWLAKCEVVARELPLLGAMRAVLHVEARRARARGDHQDAWIYAAHVSLLDDIELRGIGPVQAEIILAMR